ncbi:MAG: LysM peptidoglycan-binding domain-containing protein [Anaerolineales bacterium]
MTETGNLTPSVVPTLIQATSTATLLPPSPSPTRTVVTSTPTLNSFHTLETPIGSEYQFIIHRILDGESLDSISNKYGTTPKALRLVNYDLPIPLLTNSLIIIPVNKTDVSGLPVFEAYIVKGDVSVEDLAKQLLVDPAVLEYYNALKVGQVLTADEWVLVPHIATATP